MMQTVLSNSIRTGLTLLELLVVLAVIMMLGGTLLPAIGAAREASRRMQCVSHLRETGTALHLHHDAATKLPAGWESEPSRRTAYGWVVPILPYLEHGNLGAEIRKELPLTDAQHERVRGLSLTNLLCPSDITQPTFVLYDIWHESPLVTLPTANYLGVYGAMPPGKTRRRTVERGAFGGERGARFADFKRGLSNTLLVGERTMALLPSTWLGTSKRGEEAYERLVGAACDGINMDYPANCSFSSRHPHGTNFVWADGHVSFLAENIDRQVYMALTMLGR